MKNILVTGASRGLGLEIIKTLINQEYQIFAISRSYSDSLKEIEERFPDKLKFKSVDLSNCREIKENIFKDFISFKTPLHGIVNNAAIAYDDIITNLNLDRLEEMFRSNVFSPFNIVKYGIRNMIFNHIPGSIIHISSISAHTGYKGLSMYAATKGALEAFSKNTAREWGERNIRSNCLVVGFMETDMNAMLSVDQKNRIFNRTSLKKSTEPESVANTVEHLLSDKSRSITGQNIFIDSGTI